MRTRILPKRLMLVGILSIGLGACGQSSGAGTGGTTNPTGGSGGSTGGRGGSGGTTNTGGTAAGGTTGTGGTIASGGSKGSGGAQGTGGAVVGTGGDTAGSGGTSGTGGATISGGTFGTGGSTGGRSGATGGAGAQGTGTGGRSTSDAGSGDANGTGGLTGTGGATRTGGNSGGTRSGGANGSGGLTSTGGATGSGGGSGSSDATYVPDPGWACGMADGIPSPSKGTLAFSISFQIGATHDVGDTPYGHRRLFDVKGGTISGDKLNGSVVTGGLEYDLVLSNGVVEYHGINILKASDGAYVYLRTCGVSPSATAEARVIPIFDAATSGSTSFLNDGKFVATRVLSGTGGTGTLQLDAYDVSKVTAGDPRVTITKPSGVAKQPWDCNTTTGTQGSSVFTENVTLGSSFSFTGKKGSHNVIPITGGTTTGQVAGSILNGGADYQLSGAFDAWYTLNPSNGEFILVRNCGPSGKLIPWFEAKTDGKYNFLNTEAYLSSNPGGGSGGVSITFYERK